MASCTLPTSAAPDGVICTKILRRSASPFDRRTCPSFSSRSTIPVVAAVVWPMRGAMSGMLSDSVSRKKLSRQYGENETWPRASSFERLSANDRWRPVKICASRPASARKVDSSGRSGIGEGRAR